MASVDCAYLFMADLTCKELVELVTDYLEGTLPEADRARFDLHLTGCGGCRNYLEQMKTTIKLAGSLTEEAIPPHPKEELLQIFRNWKQQNPG